jgi:O-methyltransferase
MKFSSVSQSTVTRLPVRYILIGVVLMAAVTSAAYFAITTNSSFNTSIVHQTYAIYRPFGSQQSRVSPWSKFAHDDALVLFAPAEQWVRILTEKFTFLDTKTEPVAESALRRARDAYAQLIGNMVSGLAYGSAERSVRVELGPIKPVFQPFNESKRANGLDWTYLGTTMTGSIRISNVEMLLKRVIIGNIPGGYMETGVWRGGSSIFARAVIRAHGEGSQRVSYVCDSFAGLPVGHKELDWEDVGWDHTPYVEVDEARVARHFHELGFGNDENIVFVRGFFNHTMPILASSWMNTDEKLAILRLDGDMYESTVDVLYHMYERVSVGGFIIMDDWYGFPAQRACADFFEVHGINPEIIRIDTLAAYWVKTSKDDVPVESERYIARNFKKEKHVVAP